LYILNENCIEGLVERYKVRNWSEGRVWKFI